MNRGGRICARTLTLGARPLALCAGLAAGLLAASCNVGPDYERPASETPGAFKSATSDDAKPSHLASNWWTLYNDPELTSLITEALRANQDLKAAAARVIQARAASDVVASQFYPSVTFDPSLVRQRLSGNRTIGQTNLTSQSRTVNDVTIPIDVSYEIDIWGRVRRSYESSTAQYLASAQDFGVVLQTLTSDLAQNYYALRSLDAQEHILERSIDLYKRQVELTKTQNAAGLVGTTDVLQAQTLLHTAVGQIADIRRQRADAEHAIAVLVGKPPAELSVTVRPLDGLPPIVPAGLPSALLAQRPDVAEAEENLVAASAAVGVAKANFYPVVRLTGQAGFESIDVKHALDWESRIWSIGPSVTFPIFVGGQLSAQLEQAKAVYDERLATYRGTLLTAFREVEDSLTDLHLRADAADAQSKAVDTAREYVRLTDLQYRQGLTNYLQVIDAERTLLSNELTLTQTLGQRYISSVLLIKALGGGWKLEQVDTFPTQEPVGPPGS